MAMAGVVDFASLTAGQKLGLKYFIVAMVLFLAQLVFGLLAGMQFLYPELLYEQLDFSVNRMVHINAMIVWMLYGFIGSVYWLVEDESGVELVGVKLANLNFWVLTGAVVVVVYLFVQTGAGTIESIWFINEGREYIEAPRWADIGIVVCVLVFFYNVTATFMKGRWSGISGLLILDLMGIHTHAAADQSLHPRHAVDVIPRPSGVFRRLRDDHHRHHLPGRHTSKARPTRGSSKACTGGWCSAG